MSSDTTSQSQGTPTDPSMLEPFVGRFAQEVARQENALNQAPSSDLEAALMRVRQTWYERNNGILLVGAGVLSVLLIYRMTK